MNRRLLAADRGCARENVLLGDRELNYIDFHWLADSGEIDSVAIEMDRWSNVSSTKRLERDIRLAA